MKLFRLALFTFAALIAFSFSTQSAYADTYVIGDVYFVGNIDSGTYAPAGRIAVTGYIVNYNPYGAVPAYLNASTNGSTQTIVSQQTIPSGGSTNTEFRQFDAPSTPGSYSVAFSFGANIPAAEQIVDFQISVSGDGRNCGSSGCASVVASVSLAQALSQSITLYLDDEYWDSGVNGPNTVGFSITIPAGQTEGSQYGTIYAEGYGNTYLSSNGTYTGVNGTSTNQLSGGTLLPVFGNTKLRLTYASVGYFFSCGGGHPDYLECR